MLRITPAEDEQRLVLQLEGKLAGPWVAEAAQAWAELQPSLGKRTAVVDLTAVCFIDEDGQALLQTLHQEGCTLLGSGPFISPILQSIRQGQRILSAAMTGLLICAAIPAMAQTMAAPQATPQRAQPLRLTLRQALQRALEQNPQIQRSLLAVAQSQADTRMAKSALLPSVGAMAMGQRAKANMDTFMGGPVAPGAPVPTVVGPYNWGQIGLEAQVTLFDLSTWDRWHAAKHGETAVQAQARAAREGISALVVGQYLMGLRAAATVKASQSRVELADALATLAEHQQKEGVGTKLDSLRSQVQLQTERQRLIQAQTQLRTSIYGLAKLLDLEPTTKLELADELGAPSLPMPSLEDAFKESLKSRPELAALDAREKAATDLETGARNLRMPSLVASGSFSSTGVQHEPWVPTYTISLGVKVPLFTGGLVSARIAKAKAELDGVKEDRREIKAQVSLEVQVSRAEMESAQSEVEVANQALTFAEEALLQARHRFEAGISNNIEVINAQDELARASSNQIGALHRLNQARADLARATGQLEATFSR